MKKIRKAAVLLIVVMAGLLVLAGCGKKEIDPEKYVDAYLKASLKGDVEDLAKLSDTSEKKLEKEYEAGLQELKNQMGSLSSFDASSGEKYTEVCKELLATAKYEVSGSKKDDDGNYTVDVKVYPSDAMSIFINKCAQAGMSGGDVGDALVKAMGEAVDEQSYGDAETMQIHVNKDSDNVYSVDTSDASSLIQGLFTDVEEMLTPSGKEYDNPYLNWTKTEWNAAGDEDKTQCCLAILQELTGYTDEQIASIDVNEESVSAGIQQMKDGIELTYTGDTQISIGDYVEIMKNTGAFNQ